MKNLSNHVQRLAPRNAELADKYGPYRVPRKLYSIDSMPIVVDYVATVGRLEFFKRGEEHVFVQTKTLPDGRYGQQSDEVRENPHSIRDEFYKVRTVGQAIEFLQKTGEFSPLRPRLTWTEFQKWQMFARLVQGHDELAAAMRSNDWSGGSGEVLKALTGNYSSSFFDGCEDALYLPGLQENDPSADMLLLDELQHDRRQSMSHEEWLKAYERENRELIDQNRRANYECEKEKQRRALWQWFVHPPVTVRWQPNSDEAAQEVLKEHVDPTTGIAVPIPEDSPIMRGGAMIEFLLRRDQLKPVLVITPKYTLEAIAAAIFAERIHGITSRKCEKCGELFKVGRHKNKLYCDGKPCRSNARKARNRIHRKERAEKEARERAEKEAAESREQKTKPVKVKAPKLRKAS